MMKNVLKKITMMLVGAAFVLPSQAQLLKLTIKDKAMRENVMFANHGEFPTVECDANGVWVYDDANLKKPIEANVFFMNQSKFVPVWLEKGKTAEVIVENKKGNVKVTYKGDNADLNRFFEQYGQFNPEKREHGKREFADMDDDELREEAEKQVYEDITFEEAFRRLDHHYAATMKAAKAIKDPAHRAAYMHKTDLKDLVNRLDLNDLRIRQQKLDRKTDAEYQRLFAQIDPNDEAGLDMILHLPTTFVESKMTTTKFDRDQTAFALDYIGIVEKNITNEKVRHHLLSELGFAMFGSSFTNQVFELDKFWEAFKRVAPKRTLDEFQPIYDSRMATKAGAPCPDVTFSDPQGNPHKLSEYFGKVLYIDIWATWCGPCCAEIPYIEKHVAHYKDNPKIQFLSISIDSKKQAWLDKLEKDKPEWLQFLCNKEEYELLSKQWGITGIPRFVIINADGTINQAEAFRPSNEQFREMIDKILGE